MGLSSIQGAIGIGLQSAKGAPAANMHYLPVLSGNVMGEQLAQTLAPEVGGTYFSRGSYKAGVRGRGDLAMMPRANTIGWLLAGLFNHETVTPNGGLYDHLFRVGDTGAHPHKWITARRYVNNIYGEQIEDSRVGSFRLEVAAANVVNASVQMLGGRHSEIAGADAAAEDGSVFLTCNASVSEGGADFIVDRFSIEVGAQLTDNEFRVGSFFLDDITLLQRQITLQADVRISSRDLFSKVYRNSAVAPTGAALGAWSPTIYRTDVELVLLTGDATPQSLTLTLPGVDFLTLPVQMAGAELIRAQLTAQVTLGVDNFDPDAPDSDTLQPILLTLTNDVSDAYTYAF